MKMKEASNGGDILDRKTSELQEIHMKVMKDECRMWLLKRLLSLKLSTRDIYSFVLNQANQRVEDDILDMSTSKCAMRSKIRDIGRTLYKAYRERRRKEQEILELLDGKCFTLLKKLRNVRVKVKKEREKLKEAYLKKTEHYLRLSFDLKVKVKFF